MEFSDTVLKQYETIRASGEHNMILEVAGVQRAAYDRDLFALVTFIEDHDMATYMDMANASAAKYRDAI